MADGGVDFQIRLVNQVTGPARQVQRAMADVKKSVEQARRAVEAPAPRNRRGATPGFDQRLAAARRSQAKDFAQSQIKAAREQARLTKIKAKESAKEQKRVADFHKGMAQQKLDKQQGLVDFGSSLLGGGAAMLAAGVLAAGAAVAYLGYKFSEAAVQAAAFGQQSRLALTLLLDDAPKANKEFDAMRMEAQQLGLDVQDTQLGFQKLLAAQFEVGKAKELIRMSADLQAIGASADQTKRAIVAISQIKNTGYLQGDELNQLREAGVSTELVYKALGKRLGKTTPELIRMQEKRQLDSTNVIESVLEAVRQKTHSEKAGDAGRKFASSSLVGMAGVMKAKIQNQFIDIGDAILPGLTKLAKMAGRTLDALLANPALANLGQLLLGKFEVFVAWVQLNWEPLTKLLSIGVELMGESIRVAFDLIDTSTLKGKIFIGVLGLLAVTFGLVAVAGFVLMAPLYLLIAVIGLLGYALYKAVMWIVDSISMIPGMGGDKAPAITTAAESGPAARAMGIMYGYEAAPPTVAAQEQGAAGVSKTVNVDIGSVGTGVDKAEMAAAIRSQVTKALEEHD